MDRVGLTAVGLVGAVAAVVVAVAHPLGLDAAGTAGARRVAPAAHAAARVALAAVGLVVAAVAVRVPVAHLSRNKEKERKYNSSAALPHKMNRVLTQAMGRHEHVADWPTRCTLITLFHAVPFAFW